MYFFLMLLWCFSVFGGDALPFSGTGLFQVRGYSGVIGMSDASYDSVLHWFQGNGTSVVVTPVDFSSNSVSIRLVSSNKYLTVQNVQAPDAETSKIQLVALPQGASFDPANLFMQFYIEGTNGVYKIRSAATGGYLVSSTGAFFRASVIGSDGKYSVPASDTQAAAFNFVTQASPMNVKSGDIVRFKCSAGGYLGFNDSGAFTMITPTSVSSVPQFKVASYDAQTNTATFKVFNQSVCSVATSGSQYGGIPFSFTKSFSDLPSRFIFEGEPTKPGQFYLKLVGAGSAYYLRSSSTSSNVISSVVSDLSQRYLFSLEAGLSDPKDLLYEVSLLSQLTLQNVRDDITNRFGRIMNSSTLSTADWEYVGKTFLQYIQAASQLDGWKTPGDGNSPSLCDMAKTLLQKIPSTFSQASDVQVMRSALDDIGLPSMVSQLALNDTVLLQVADGEFLGVDNTDKIVSRQSNLYDPTTHFKIVTYDPVAKTISFQVGAKYLAIDSAGRALVLSPSTTVLPITLNRDTKQISFTGSGGQPVTIGSGNGQNLSNVKIVQKVAPDIAVFDQSLRAMQGVLTKDIVITNLLNVFQPFMVKPQKTAAEWTFFVSFLVSFLTKASTDIAQWKVPSIDIVDQGQTRRISLCEYASILVSYIADPFSPAPADVQARARAFMQILTAAPQVVTPQVTPSSTPFVPGGLVLLQSADGVKTMLVNAQGIAQFLTGVTKFNPLIQAQVVAYDAAASRVKLSFSGRCFDQLSSSFSLTSSASAQFFTIEATSDPLVNYLTLGQGRRLTLGDNFVSGCALNAQGTPFKITALNSVYSSLPQVKIPATAQEFENSLKAYFSAFDIVRDSSDDMTRVFQGLRDYCSLVAPMPDWSLQMNGAIIVNDSPLNYVKTSLQTLLTLSLRYAGLTNTLKSTIQQFLASPVFIPIQISSTLATGALCVLKIDDSSAVTVDSSGVCRGQSYSNLLEPSVHGTIDRFDPATLSLNFSLIGKKMGTNASNQLVASASYGAFRVVNEGSSGYSIMNTQNKKLRYDPTAKTIAFADTGTVLQIVIIQPNRCLLDAISGDTARDLKIFESALLQVRTSGDDVNFIVDKLIQYVQQASQVISWYTATGIDTRNPSTTLRDYAVILLRRVKESPTVFTVVSQSLKDKITATVNAMQDNTQLYSQQINLLDGLAAKLKEASTVTSSSELMQMLTGLIDKILAGGNVDQRVLLLQKVESYGNPTVVTGLAQASDIAKKAWNMQIVRFMDKLLTYDAADAGAWEDKFSSIKNKLFARVLSASADKISLMQIILNSSVKKLIKEGSGISAQLTSWKSLKQQLNNFAFDISQQLLASSDSTQTASISDVQNTLNALLVSGGMKKEEVVVPAPQPVPVQTPPPVVDTPPVTQVKKPLIPGLISTSEPNEWGSEFSVTSPASSVTSGSATNGVDANQSGNEQSAPAQVKFEI